MGKKRKQQVTKGEESATSAVPMAEAKMEQLDKMLSANSSVKKRDKKVGVRKLRAGRAGFFEGKWRKKAHDFWVRSRA
jgi:hypothetical protein